MIHSGRLEEAERDCQELRRRFPQTMDWIAHAAEIAERKGDTARAIDHCRRCIDYIDRDPDGFDEEIKTEYARKIAQLEQADRAR